MERAAVKKLSSAPVEEWGALLQDFGVSLTDRSSPADPVSAPFCTVSSLLEMMQPPPHQPSGFSSASAPMTRRAEELLSSAVATQRIAAATAAAVTAHEEEQPGRTGAVMKDAEALRAQARKTLLRASIDGTLAQTLAKSAANAPGEKAQPAQPAPSPAQLRPARRRRSQLREASPPATKEEDPRDLDELLRQLGEEPAVATTSAPKKKKAKAAWKQAPAAPPAPKQASAAPPAPKTKSRPEPQAKAGRSAGDYSRPSKAADVTDSLKDEQALEGTDGAEQESTAADGTEDFPAEESTAADGTEEGADEAEWRVVAPRGAIARHSQETAEFAAEQAAELAAEHATRGEAPTVAMAEDALGPEEAAAEPTRGRACEMEGHGSALARESQASEAAAGLATETEVVDSVTVAPTGAACPGASMFTVRPSVATWLGEHRRFRSSSPPCGNDEVTGAAACSSRCRSQGADTNCSRTWRHRSSVATWLQQSPLNSERPARGSRSPSRRDILLWPSTPESTPPNSPRAPPGGFVWMAVPTALIADVQDLIRTRQAAGFA